MREWNLRADDLRSLPLAADARLGPTDYAADQIWELALVGGEPPALALQTTYGLRARSLRLFPRFVEGDSVRNDPLEFALPPVVRCFYPNFLWVTFSPFPELEVEAEYWAAQSDAVAGRLRVTNRGAASRQFRLEWAALLTPAEGGQRMAPLEIEAAWVLAGASGGLAPVLFMTGGAVVAPGPFPALAHGLDLAPGRSRQLSWSCAALSNPADSFSLARRTAARNLDAERARLQLLNAGQVEIHTGDPDWDLAFALAQDFALGLFAGPTPHLPHPSFVIARQPDHGASLRGDGSDYGHLWNGQTPLDAYTLAGLLLPGQASLLHGLLENFLAIQEPDGSIDWKPGLGGQRGNRLAPPLLACLALRLFEADGDRAALEKAFPGLLRFLQAWFAPEHDRDGDGIPEWDHPLQAGFEDHPLFSRWHDWAKNVDITTAESPALCSLLYRESLALIQIARQIGQQEAIPELEATAARLRAAVEDSWDARAATYRYWDRDFHATPDDRLMGRRNGSGVIAVQGEFERPYRLLLRVKARAEITRRSQAFVHGVGPSGHHRVEHIASDRFQWFLGLGSATSERVYHRVEYVEIQGLDEADEVSLHGAGLTCQDHTLLLPLWAGIPSPRRARSLVTQALTNPRRYWLPYGIPACPQAVSGEEARVCRLVYIPWVTLIGEGLIDYGYRQEAAGLVARLMKAAIQSLKSEGAFRRYYLADTGQGLGERNALEGLPPLGLFLNALGVRLYSPHRVALAGFNPFPWPVTVKYRGLTILRQKEKTLVIFPDGQTVAVDDPEPREVALE